METEILEAIAADLIERGHDVRTRLMDEYFNGWKWTEQTTHLAIDGSTHLTIKNGALKIHSTVVHGIHQIPLCDPLMFTKLYKVIELLTERDLPYVDIIETSSSSVNYEFHG